jgi:hypothetical protein
MAYPTTDALAATSVVWIIQKERIYVFHSARAGILHAVKAQAVPILQLSHRRSVYYALPIAVASCAVACIKKGGQVLETSEKVDDRLIRPIEGPELERIDTADASLMNAICALALGMNPVLRIGNTIPHDLANTVTKRLSEFSKKIYAIVGLVSYLLGAGSRSLSTGYVLPCCSEDMLETRWR